MKLRSAFASVAIFAGATGASAYIASRATTVNSTAEQVRSDSGSVATTASSRIEAQLVLVYVGRASCRWCTSPELHSALDSVRDLLRARADTFGMNFRFYGIGVDFDPRASLKHLEQLGPFDAVSAGDRWLSFSAGQLVRGAMAGPRATPQLLLVARQVRAAGTLESGYHDVLSEQIIARKVGMGEIQEWLTHGLPEASRSLVRSEAGSGVRPTEAQQIPGAQRRAIRRQTQP